MPSDQAKQPLRGVAWLARLAAVVCGVAAALIGLELALRWFVGVRPMSTDPSFLCIRFDPVYGLIGKEGARARGVLVGRQWDVAINEHGFRDDPWTREKRPGVPRILLLGDSFVYGVGVRAADRVSNVLARRLNAEVLAAGVTGWSPAQEGLWLTNEGLALRPDVVVEMLTLGNDFDDLLWPPNRPRLQRQADGRVVVTGGPFREPRGFYPTTPLEAGDPRSWFMRRTAVYAFMLSRVRASVPITQALQRLGLHPRGTGDETRPPADVRIQFDPELQRAADLLFDYLREQRGQCAAAGADHLVFLIPSEWQVDVALWSRLLAAHRFYVEGEEEVTSFLSDLVNDELTARGVRCVDPLPRFLELARGGTALYIAGDGHWTEAGHAAAAELLAEAMARPAGKSAH